MSFVACKADIGQASPTCEQRIGLEFSDLIHCQKREIGLLKAMDCSPLQTFKDRNKINE